VVPFVAGGPDDVVARLVAQRLQEDQKSSFVVENVAGGGGRPASASVTRAAPDGQTLLIATTSTLAISASLFKELPYDPVKSFAPVSLLATSSLSIVIDSKLQPTTLAELVAYARANPGKLNFGSPGIGTIPHLAGELFMKEAGIKLNQVPYRGVGAATNDLVAGHIDVAFEAPAGMVTQHKAGTLRILATTSKNRLPILPDVPTAIEAGFPGMGVTFWTALVAPAGTPAAIVEKLSVATRDALAHPDTAVRLKGMGLAPTYEDSKKFADRLGADIEAWRKVITDAGIKSQ
jgi:tripartite-type tricarboxylate transporter receptor subunit TctC